MASVFSQVKLFFTSFLVLYTFYLLQYKCVQLKETKLEHSIKSTFHPLTHTHNQACEVLNQGTDFVKPYLTQAHQFLDTHVHSHPLFKQYKVEEKLQVGASHYQTYVAPYVVQLYQFIEVLELRIYEYLLQAYTEAKKVYEQYTK